MHFIPKTSEGFCENGSGRAPAALSLERLHNDGLNELPPNHPYTITVPGACAGMCDLLDRYGNLSMAEVLVPAIKLSEEGFPVALLTSHYWHLWTEKLLVNSLNGNELTIGGRGPKSGELFINPGLARTFRKIAKEGKNIFYEGEIAKAIVATVREAGGCLSLDDMASHTSTWETPISTTYRGFRVYECPPNGQGLTALIALNILEGFELDSFYPLSTHRLHLEIEALRMAFADSRWYISDPTFVHIPVNELLSKQYAAERRKLIDPNKTTLKRAFGVPVRNSNTVYLSVIDSQGNACSFTNSNYEEFGTGIVPSGWGFALQNRGHNFSLDSQHPNVLSPGKRPYHTIIPAMATRTLDGSLFASFGVMGGFMQPQGHVQIFSALVDDEVNPQSALDMPRFCIESGEPGGRVGLEEGISKKTIKGLLECGHPLRIVKGWDRSLFGRGQIILRDQKTGVLIGGSDPRSDGCAMPSL